MCYLQNIRCYVICKMTISCYVLCKIKWLLLCAMCSKMASAMCYVKPLEGPHHPVDLEHAVLYKASASQVVDSSFGDNFTCVRNMYIYHNSVY